ncbi:DinB family protein [Chitinophagaceae bacterium LB-8]|uniref:DinB family protein n=1 Tax=Paraflavisolibacter caeni TaxID=2982496 RepID=A0A9X3BHD4_9BACT|nr:DinB family protein [Paraflavisolibacter caeni]MCU7548708.1 DinB family protein [Paraflavisolibacter caeni]
MISVFKPKTSLLLALLVITGLAGRPSFETISGAERRFLTHQLRESKANLIKSVKGLSEEQLNYKPFPDQWSINECLQHLAISENEIWKMTEAVIKQPTNEGKRSEIKTSDEEVLKNFSNRNQKFQTFETMLPAASSGKTTNEALSEFKHARNHLIKFSRSTTDDLRDHVSITPEGASDAYQLILMIAANTQKHIQQIEELKKSKNFPKG